MRRIISYIRVFAQKQGRLKVDGSLWEFEGEVWVKQDPGYYASGSGSPYAFAAMDAGASARDAVRIAIKRDANSGGRVQSLRLK